MRYLPEPSHGHDEIARTGILLTNLGTPEAPTAQALRKYLRQFLWDPRVVELPRPLWWLILNGIILNTRPKKSAAKYAKIWTPDGSPLLDHTRKQATMLKGFLGERFKSPLVVEIAMRYGEPSIEAALGRLKSQCCDRVLVLPLYPQYSASTTASALDEVFRVLGHTRNVPELRTVRHFHDHPGYIGALAASVRDHWMKNGRPEKLVMSFHGLPRRSLDLGDPYHCECHKTGRLLSEALGLNEKQYLITFQSRFGAAEWLQPYTQPTLEKLAREGTQSVGVICPGFAADCLETLEEIALECKAAFLSAGGQTFHYIPCLNESNDWITALADIASRHLGNWVTADWDEAAARERAQSTRHLALALGAEADRS